MRIYLKKNFAKFHPDLTIHDGALGFLPRDASAERGYEIAFVCPSVRL